MRLKFTVEVIEYVQGYRTKSGVRCVNHPARASFWLRTDGGRVDCMHGFDYDNCSFHSRRQALQVVRREFGRKGVVIKEYPIRVPRDNEGG